MAAEIWLVRQSRSPAGGTSYSVEVELEELGLGWDRQAAPWDAFELWDHVVDQHGEVTKASFSWCSPVDRVMNIARNVYETGELGSALEEPAVVEWLDAFVKTTKRERGSRPIHPRALDPYVVLQHVGAGLIFPLHVDDGWPASALEALRALPLPEWADIDTSDGPEPFLRLAAGKTLADLERHLQKEHAAEEAACARAKEWNELLLSRFRQRRR